MILEIAGNDVVKPWLPTKLVYPLGDLVSCSIAQAREERAEFATDRSCGIITEDDAVEC